MDQTINYRNRKRKCKRCSKEFQSEFYRKICPECNKKEKTKNSLNGWENEEYLMQKWKKLKGKMTITKAITPKYDNIDTYDTSTTEICSTCEKPHYKTKEYNHDFTKEIYVTGIPIETLPEMLTDYNKTHNKENFLQKRGLLA